MNRSTKIGFTAKAASRRIHLQTHLWRIPRDIKGVVSYHCARGVKSVFLFLDIIRRHLQTNPTSTPIELHKLEHKLLEHILRDLRLTMHAYVAR